MISFQRQTRLDLSNCPSWRGIRVLFIISCLFLAGCAGMQKDSDSKATSSLDGTESYDAEWRAAQDDPIGMLLANDLRKRASRKSTSDNPRLASSSLAIEALNYLGVRYRYGGDTPDSGFDCSGLVGFAASHAMGVKLPRSAAEMAQLGVPVGREQLAAGDLVFFNTMGRRYSHVGIYLGDDRFVHSPSAGGRVRIERLSMAYWDRRYEGARRIGQNLQASASLN
jgi:cell wall-associated NlpC family hydrolase